MAIYFGGSRHLPQSQILHQVVHSVLLSGQSIHVGCQKGADRQVLQYASSCYSGQFVSSLFVFAVASNPSQVHSSIQQLPASQVTYSAGGQVAPIKARYLLRSMAAFKGCSSAVFFSPGAGSLAVARECVKVGKPVFAFGDQPAPIASSASGMWCLAWFMGFQCWGWGTLSNQMSLF